MSVVGVATKLMNYTVSALITIQSQLSYIKKKKKNPHPKKNEGNLGKTLYV